MFWTLFTRWCRSFLSVCTLKLFKWLAIPMPAKLKLKFTPICLFVHLERSPHGAGNTATC